MTETPYKIGDRVSVLGAPATVVAIWWESERATHIDVVLDAAALVPGQDPHIRKIPIVTSLEPTS